MSGRAIMTAVEKITPTRYIGDARRCGSSPWKPAMTCFRTSLRVKVCFVAGAALAAGAATGERSICLDAEAAISAADLSAVAGVAFEAAGADGLFVAGGAEGVFAAADADGVLAAGGAGGAFAA